MIVTIVNLSTPDSVNRAQPIFACLNFQVFELSWWMPGDKEIEHEIVLFDDRVTKIAMLLIYKQPVWFCFPEQTLVSRIEASLPPAAS